MLLNEWQVGRDAHKQNKIPFFFQEFWTKKNGENPLNNEDRHRKISARAVNWFNCGMLCGALCLFLGVVAQIAPPFRQWQQTTIPLLLYGGIATGAVIFFVCGGLVSPSISRTLQKGKWNFDEYYSRLYRLFVLFEVIPNTEIGKLKREEFAGLVAGSLRAKMSEVDTKEGFARLDDYNQFKRMHEAALFWELCDPDYGRYDPKKQ